MDTLSLWTIIVFKCFVSFWSESKQQVWNVALNVGFDLTRKGDLGVDQNEPQLVWKELNLVWTFGPVSEGWGSL